MSVIVFIMFLQDIGYLLKILIFTWIFQLFISKSNFFTDSLILFTIRNSSTRTKLHSKNYLLISSTSTNHPNNTGGQIIIVRDIGIQLKTNQFQVKYVNTLLDPVNVSVWHIPESGDLGKLDFDLTLNSTLLMFTLYVLENDWKTAYYFILH